MKKTIKKVGDSIGIIFNKEEAQIYNISVGDVIDLGDIVIKKRKNGKKENK